MDIIKKSVFFQIQHVFSLFFTIFWGMWLVYVASASSFRSFLLKILLAYDAFDYHEISKNNPINKLLSPIVPNLNIV